MKLKVVEVPSIKRLVVESPGFAKKALSTYKLDLMALCGFSCRYCSSNNGNYLRTNRGRFADLTEQQTGERTLPGEDPSLTFEWPDVLAKLERELVARPKSFGAGQTLVFSMLTDGFSPRLVGNDTTETALRMLLKRTSFRIRVLTKNAVVGSSRWIGFFQEHPGRFVVGLSTGSLDDEWARRVEIGTSSPSARLKAHRALQEAGVPTYGMLCPIFPDALPRLSELLDSIRPQLCEHVWAEPYNDRANWRAVQSGYDVESPGWKWFERVFGDRSEAWWSEYAADLFMKLRHHAAEDGWLSRLRYLLYEESVDLSDVPWFSDLAGVLLQSPKETDGRSKHPGFAAIQNAAGVGPMPGCAA